MKKKLQKNKTFGTTLLNFVLRAVSSVLPENTEKDFLRMKYLIVGLGNPGSEYENTRHNIGFKILDALADASNIVFSDKRYGFVTEYKFKARTFILLKPTTYMNLSGKAVNYWLQKEKFHSRTF